MTDRIRVRPATVSELPDVLNVLDGAVLAVDAGRLRSAIDRDEVLVAVTPGAGSDTDRILGALALDGTEITAVAVRQRRRDQGIGTALVDAAAERRDRLVAEFDSRVHPFWDALGFTAERIGDGSGRYHGVR